VIGGWRNRRLHFGSDGGRQLHAGCEAGGWQSDGEQDEDQALAGHALDSSLWVTPKKIAPHEAGRLQARGFRSYLEMSEPKL
jgi:hypothetical protein